MFVVSYNSGATEGFCSTVYRFVSKNTFETYFFISRTISAKSVTQTRKGNKKFWESTSELFNNLNYILQNSQVCFDRLSQNFLVVTHLIELSVHCLNLFIIEKKKLNDLHVTVNSFGCSRNNRMDIFLFNL